jgi:acyl-coenzyme A synthetase/AMP-(fatty) acid ligase
MNARQHNAVRNAHNLENVFAAQRGKALVPKEVLFVGDMPKTQNAKVMRRIVRAAYLGDTSALSAKLRAMATERGIKVGIAYDRMKLEL